MTKGMWPADGMRNTSNFWFYISPQFNISAMLNNDVTDFRNSSATLKPKFHLARHITSRHNMFDVSSESRRASRAVLFDKLGTAKMHGLDTSNVSCRVEFWRNSLKRLRMYIAKSRSSTLQTGTYYITGLLHLRSNNIRSFNNSMPIQGP